MKTAGGTQAIVIVYKLRGQLFQGPLKQMDGIALNGPGLHKNFKIKNRVVVCSSPWFCIVKIAKNGHVHEGGKVGRSNATPTKLLSVDSYDLNL